MKWATVGVTAIALAIVGAVIPGDGAEALQPGEWAANGELLLGGIPVNSYDAAVDAETGDVYVVDAFAHAVWKFTADGQNLYKLGKPGTENGSFNEPRGIAVDASRNVYVVDLGNDRVQKFDRNGTFLGKWGTEGAGNGQFSSPSGIAVDGQGNLLVSDTGNHRIQKFDDDGNFLAKWGSYGSSDKQFKSPMGISVSGGGAVVVADALNNRVQVFDTSGAFLTKWGTAGTGAGQFQTPLDVAIGQNNEVFVADFGNDRIQHLSLLGAYLDSLGTANEPRSVALDVARSKMYVPSLTGTRLIQPASVPTFTAGPRTFAVAGKPYVSTLRTVAIPAVSHYSVINGLLPPGLHLDQNVVKGVPTRPGKYALVVQADNEVNPTGTKAFTITIGKATSKVTASWSTKHPRVKKTNLKATIRVSAPATTGLSRTGKIRVYFGSKRVKTVTLYKSHNGTVKVRLPKFTKRGKTKVTVKFVGNAQMKASRISTYVRVK